MSTINFIIDGTDVSEYIEAEAYSVNRVWETSEGFTDYTGKAVSFSKGYHYELSLNLEDVPDPVMRELTAALAKKTVSITFTDPHSVDCTTAQFLRGDSTGGEASNEYDGEIHWNLSMRLKSELVPSGDGL